MNSKTLKEWQILLDETYGARDRARGPERTLLWLIEEIGELARASHRGTSDQRVLEWSDAFAWLVSVATVYGIDVEAAMARYSEGCPKCQSKPCQCA